MLLNVALDRYKIHRWLSITSGILALISAGAITTVLTKLVGSSVFQIVAAITAFCSGIISIISSNYKDDETSKIFAGSSKYLDLRNRTIAVILHPDKNEKEYNKQLIHLENEYVNLDAQYSRYFSRCETKTSESKWWQKKQRELSLPIDFLDDSFPKSSDDQIEPII